MTTDHAIARTASLPGAFSAPYVSLGILTLQEVARELRCSRAQLYNILGGKLSGLPPLPVFHIGRRALVRSAALHAWVRTLETRERKDYYATGFFGLPDDDLEFIAGA